LWLEKTGRKEPEDLSEKEAVIWGTILEPILARVYAERTGRKVRRVNAVLQHPTHVSCWPIWIGRCVVQKKAGAFSKSRQPVITPQWKAFGAYQCQVLHQLANRTGLGDVAVLIWWSGFPDLSGESR
jgi:predicted phage-related endonuclease